MSPRLRRIAMDDGARLAVRVEGPEEAPVVILSPSLGTGLELWAPQTPALSGRMRVVSYDPRGHGRSSAPAGAYGIDRLGRDVLEIMDALELPTAAFCGVSMGGMVGQWLGVRAPERFTRLVLANTSAFMGPAKGWQARIGQVRTGGMAAIAPAVLERWFTPGFRAAAPQAVASIEALLLATPARGYAGCCAAIRDMDQRATAPLITPPTLVIAGLHDPATPPDHARFLAERIPRARLVELDAAHLSNIEAPEAFNAALLEALD